MIDSFNVKRFWEIEFSRRSQSLDPFRQSGRSKPFPLIDFLYSTQQCIKLLNIKPNHSVLDIGCANGLVDILLSTLCAEVTAIDPVKELVDIARQNLRDCPNVKVEVGNAEKINAPNRRFDRILMGGVLLLIHPTNISKVLAESLRVLKYEGLILASSNPDARKKDIYMNELDKMLESHPEIPHSEKQHIMECNGNATWFNPDELIALCHHLGADATVHKLTPQETESDYRFHLLISLKNS